MEKNTKSIHTEFLAVCGITVKPGVFKNQVTASNAPVLPSTQVTQSRTCRSAASSVGAFDEGDLWILVALLDIGTVEHTRDPGASATPAFKACGWRSLASHDVECLQYLFWLVVFVSFSFRVQCSTKR